MSSQLDKTPAAPANATPEPFILTGITPRP